MSVYPCDLTIFSVGFHNLLHRAVEVLTEWTIEIGIFHNHDWCIWIAEDVIIFSDWRYLNVCGYLLVLCIISNLHWIPSISEVTGIDNCTADEESSNDDCDRYPKR